MRASLPHFLPNLYLQKKKRKKKRKKRRAMSYLHFISNNSNSKNGFCKQKWSGKIIIVTVVAAYSGNWPMENIKKTHHIILNCILSLKQEFMSPYFTTNAMTLKLKYLDSWRKLKKEISQKKQSNRERKKIK